MIKLEKNSVNRVVVTLTENVTIEAPVYFLFEFISDDTKISKIFTATDISNNICRYNEFTIEETDGVEDLLNGVIDLEPNGYYHYNIYQMSDPTNLDIDLTDGIVEKGKVYFKGDIKPVRTSYTDNDENTYIAYE
tara:strand:- start:967 stop:1371 length:405 start_codon:yes stop_codon:yes gene_type:complete